MNSSEMNSVAYGLGKRAAKAGAECEPLDDALFAQYLEKNDMLPLTATIAEYVSGFYDTRNASNKKAQARRDAFKVIK